MLVRYRFGMICCRTFGCGPLTFGAAGVCGWLHVGIETLFAVGSRSFGCGFVRAMSALSSNRLREYVFTSHLPSSGPSSSITMTEPGGALHNPTWQGRSTVAPFR